MGFSIDALSVVMLIVVTVVASMVMIYSIGYMHGDKRYPAVLRVSLALLRGDAHAGHREQHPADVHELGTGRADVVSADRVLVRETLGDARGKEGVSW